MDQQGPEKVLRVLKFLMSNISLSIEEIAYRLNTSKRTIYRYIDTFKTAGFPVKHLRGTVYKIEDERISLERQDAALPKMRHSYSELRKYILSHPHLSDTAKVNRLKTAIKERKKVVLSRYRSSAQNIIKDRMIEPYDFTDDFARVWAYDLYEEKNILYKISRIGHVQILSENWTQEPSHRRQHVDIFGHAGHQKQEVVLKLSLKAANHLQEMLPLSAADISEESDGWYLRTAVCDYEGMCSFFMGMCNEVTIISPQSLKDYAKEYLQNTVARYFQRDDI